MCCWRAYGQQGCLVVRESTQTETDIGIYANVVYPDKMSLTNIHEQAHSCYKISYLVGWAYVIGTHAKLESPKRVHTVPLQLLHTAVFYFFFNLHLDPELHQNTHSINLIFGENIKIYNIIKIRALFKNDSFQYPASWKQDGKNHIFIRDNNVA